jgi:hypothetical protein
MQLVETLASMNIQPVSVLLLLIQEARAFLGQEYLTKRQ